MKKHSYLQIKILVFWLSFAPFVTYSQSKFLSEKYQLLPFGSIKPSGWIKTQMQKDMEGFVGNLDELVRE